MALSPALHAALAVLRRRPADLFPLYLLGTAVPAVARVVVLIGFIAVAVSLELAGRLGPVAADLAGRQLTPPDPEASPEAVAAWADGLAAAIGSAVTPETVGLLALTAVAAVAVAVVTDAAVTAGQLSACHARLGDRRGLHAGLVGARAHWRALLVATLLEAGALVGASAVAVGAVAAAASASAVAALVVGLLVLPGWLLLVGGTRALFAFVPVAIVVDGVGVVAGIRASAGFVRRNPVDAAGYYVVAVGALLATGSLAGLAAFVEAPAVVLPLGVLVVSPVLDLVKTGLFAAARGSFSPPSAPATPPREQVRDGIRRGLVAVARFVRDAPGLHLVALGLTAAGVLGGWTVAGPFAGALGTSIDGRLAGHLPPVAAANFLANNWTVAASTALSGVALGVPAAVSLGFNGFVVGAVARLEVEPLHLAAFLLPHGVVEVPALVIAGALGLHVGAVVWRSLRGRSRRAAVADALERAFHVLVGLAVLFAVAALLEAFISPYYWRPFV